MPVWHNAVASPTSGMAMLTTCTTHPLRNNVKQKCFVPFRQLQAIDHRQVQVRKTTKQIVSVRTRGTRLHTWATNNEHTRHCTQFCTHLHMRLPQIEPMPRYSSNGGALSAASSRTELYAVRIFSYLSASPEPTIPARQQCTKCFLGTDQEDEEGLRRCVYDNGTRSELRPSVDFKRPPHGPASWSPQLLQQKWQQLKQRNMRCGDRCNEPWRVATLSVTLSGQDYISREVKYREEVSSTVGLPATNCVWNS